MVWMGPMKSGQEAVKEADDRTRIKVLSVGLRKHIQVIFTRHSASKRVGRDTSKHTQRKENLHRVMTQKPNVVS